MKAALLDTDILSEFLRGNPKVISEADNYLKDFGEINISVITYYEILNGLLYKDAKKQLKKFLAFAELCNIIPLTREAAEVASEIQAKLRRKGTVIGHTDTLIAGIAISNNLTLVTNNTSHFVRVKNLELANWKK